MTRPVSVGTAAALPGPVTEPGWFAQLEFATGTVRICSFGETVWNSETWNGAQFNASLTDGNGKRARISIWDFDASFRTLALTDGGIRNQPVTIWKAYRSALGDTDPNMVYKGVGDSVRIAKGRVEIDCARLNSGVLLAPRRRIGPATGFNFLASPGQVISWGDTTITLEGRR